MFKSILNPTASVAVGIGLAAVDLWIFTNHVPPIADIRTADPGNADVETARRQATIMSVAVNGLVSVMTGDWNVFLIGGAVTAGFSFLLCHANAVHPATGTMKSPEENTAIATSNGEAGYNLPDYGYDMANN